MIKYIRKFLIKNKILYAFVKFLYVNLNPIIIKRRYINYRLEKFLDALLLRLNKIRFIQVGSNDGVQNDPLRKYILKNNAWTGLLIEPVPNIFKNLKNLYEDNSRFTVLNCAISDTSSKTLEFFYVSDEAKILGEGLPVWYNQLGSFGKNNIIKHLDGLLEPFIISESVSIRTLDSLAEEYGTFDLLHIDAEGHDYQVLNSLNLDKYQPGIILIEYKHLGNEQLQAMINKFIRYQYKYRFFFG